jgi:hypothetical protein
MFEDCHHDWYYVSITFAISPMLPTGSLKLAVLTPHGRSKWPALMSSLATAEPMNPDAPVIKTFIILLFFRWAYTRRGKQTQSNRQAF